MNPNNILLPSFTNKHNEILEKLKTKHVIVEGVAGSGKTATIFHIARRFANKELLYLTYNSNKRLELKEQALLENYRNLHIECYHSFCEKFFGFCSTDIQISNYVKNIRSIAFREPFLYNIIIIDETQDLVPLYVSLLHWIFSKFSAEINDFRVCFMGDLNKCVYQYRRADKRYLQYAQEIFRKSLNNCEWETVKLGEKSFRLSEDMTNFINKCLMKERILIPGKKLLSPSVVYLKSKDPDSLFVYILKNFGEQMRKNPSDFMVLAPSLDKNYSVKKFANLLTDLREKSIPIYVPNEEDKTPDIRLFYNKVLFSTFHQCTGLERKNVIIMNFDESFYAFNLISDRNKCPNLIYSAITRASEKLILVHEEKYNYLPFLDESALVQAKEKNRIKVIELNKQFLVKDLVKHISFQLNEKLMKYVNEINMIPLNNNNNINRNNDEVIVYQPATGKYEDCGDINVLALTAFFKFNQRLPQQNSEDHLLFRSYYFNYFQNDTENTIFNKLMKAAMHERCRETGYYFKKSQLKTLESINRANRDLYKARINNLGISPSAQFEKDARCTTKFKDKEKTMKFDIKGRFDCLDRTNENVWEFKFTNKPLDERSKLELAIHMYMNQEIQEKQEEKKLIKFIRKPKIKKKQNNKKEKVIYKGMKMKNIRKKKEKSKIVKGNLFNILTNEKFELRSTLGKLRKMMKILLLSKNRENKAKKISKRKFMRETEKLIMKAGLP